MNTIDSDTALPSFVNASVDAVLAIKIPPGVKSNNYSRQSPKLVRAPHTSPVGPLFTGCFGASGGETTWYAR